MSRKIIVTNQSVLEGKYQPTGWINIQGALAGLVTADAGRGITTEVVRIDSAADMAAYGGHPVGAPGDEQQAKDAVDAISSADPDYILLLGAPDVVPHQNLANPVPTDGDSMVPSDLPYACAHPYSTTISDFLAPSRVVGRVPDLVAGNNPSYLVQRIDDAAAANPYPIGQYANGFTIGAAVWHHSTLMSAHNIFASPTVHQAPPTTTPLGVTQVGNRAHFINCHGATADPHFYGEDLAGSFPQAMSVADVQGNIQHGTVAAAECCYGAEIYNPALAVGQQGICQTYLEQGAYGFFGSTNIAYGPHNGNDAADLMAQFFLREAITGSSLGRAALAARLDYVAAHTVMYPVDLKTIAQFLLLGDPSTHPVHPSRPTTREAFVAKSLALLETTAYTERDQDGTPAGIDAALVALAGQVGMDGYAVTSYSVGAPDGYWAKSPVNPNEQRVHVLTQTPDAIDGVVRPIRVVVVSEEGGQIVATREYRAKGRWHGNVVRKRVAHGSKSDRSAVVMISDADSREYILRRLGGNPFRDSELDELVGHHLHCEGDLSGQTLILKSYRIDDD